MKFLNTYKLYSALTLGLLILASCGGDKQTATENPVASSQNTVELTPQQAKQIELKLGRPEPRSLAGVIKVNGMLDVPPQNLVSVSAPMGGFVKNTELLQGMRIEKGQALVTLQHADYIQLQQDYLDTKSQLEYLETEYKRQQDLAKDNVNALKSLQQARAQYESTLARNAGLRAKLQLTGIDADKLSSNSLQQSITLVSPISGFVMAVNVNLGMYVNPTDVMFKLVNTEHLHAELTVFERDVPKLKIGQKVRFTLANESGERSATVYLIGREIGADRTVRVHCHLDEEDLDLLPGMYLRAYIETGNSTTLALPDAAIVSYGARQYVFVEAGSHRFELVEVTKGLSELGYTGLAEGAGVLKDKNVVIHGAYDLLAKLKNSED